MVNVVSYLVRNSNIPKLLKYKIYTHFDTQWYQFTNLINKYVYYKILFNVDKTQSYNINFKLKKLLKYINIIKFEDTPFVEFLLYKFFRIPLLSYELTMFEMIIYIIILIILYIMYKNNLFYKLYIKYK